MSVKLLLLKSGETIISDVKELVSNKGPKKTHGYLLIKPQKLRIEQPFLYEETPQEEVKTEIKISMSPWISLSDDEEIVIKPDWVVTVVNSIESVRTMYEEKISCKHTEEVIENNDDKDTSSSKQ